MTDINPTPSWAAVRQLEIGEFAFGGANGNMNEQAKSLAARSEFLKQRAAYQYNTMAEAIADIANIAVNQNVNVVDSGRYYKATAGATTLTKSPYDPLTQSKSYTDDKTKGIENDQDVSIYKLVDTVGNVIAYFDSDSDLFLTTLDRSVQAYIKELVASSPTLSADSLHLKVVDKIGNVITYFDENSVLNVANSINVGGKSLEQIIAENSDSQSSVNLTMQTMLTNTTPQLKALTPIRTKAEVGTVQRMPFGIKTDYGLLCFFHSGITGYDGDNQGSELWKAIVDIDSVFNVSVRSTELFLAPDEPRGIVKHPMLGRLADNRIILIFEKRLEITDDYAQYVCYSSNDGLTFTAPVLMDIQGRVSKTVLGSTGTVLTLSNGRLVCPMYTHSSRQCGALYSDDNGTTWQQSSLTVNQQIGEPTLTLETDRILMSTRVNNVRKRYFFESKDNGESWSKLALEIDGADCEASIFYDDETNVTILSHVSATDGTRTKYRFSISHTKSKTYDLTYKPVIDSYYIGYSQIVKLDSGVYALVHEYADSFVSVNNNENSGILILSAKEVFNHVSRN